MASLLHSTFLDGGSSAISSLVVTISSTTAGSTIIVTTFEDRTGSNPTSVTDSASQNYTEAPVQTGSGHGTICQAYFANSVAGVTTVTVNLGGQIAVMGVLVEEWSGLTATPADTNSTGTDVFGHGGDTIDTGTSPATAQANELILACFQQSAGTGAQTQTFSTPTGFTLDKTGTYAASAGPEYLVAYKVVSATGTQDATSVITTTNPAGGGVQTQGFISTWKIAALVDIQMFDLTPGSCVTWREN